MKQINNGQEKKEERNKSRLRRGGKEGGNPKDGNLEEEKGWFGGLDTLGMSSDDCILLPGSAVAHPSRPLSFFAFHSISANPPLDSKSHTAPRSHIRVRRKKGNWNLLEGKGLKVRFFFFFPGSLSPLSKKFKFFDRTSSRSSTSTAADTFTTTTSQKIPFRSELIKGEGIPLGAWPRGTGGEWEG